MAVRTPILAVVGRPNVGKSTFFNRVLGTQRAVVEDVPGVTRDRNYALVERFEFPFYLVDTGGFEESSEDELQQLVAEQAKLAAEEADIIIAMFDGQAGCRPGDEEVVNLLRGQRKPVCYLVNKCDGKEQAILAADFYSLGIDPSATVSALHGRGVREFIEHTLKLLPNYQSQIDAELARRRREEEAAERAARLEENAVQAAAAAAAGSGLPAACGNLAIELDVDEMQSEVEAGPEPVFMPVFRGGAAGEETAEEYIKKHRLLSLEESVSRGKPAGATLNEEAEEEESEEQQEPVLECIRVALIGRPNVGKSTMLNTLTGEQRAITSPIAGTTRDSLDLPLTRDSQRYLIIDTAGLRKKARIGDNVERFSTLRSMRAISECDVAVVMLDAVQGPTEQDAKIVGLAHEQGRGIVIAVNKWDLVEKDHRSVQEFKDTIRRAFKFSPYAPVVFVSALSGKRCPKIIETVRRVAYSRARRISTTRLNRVLQQAMRRKTPPVVRGRPLKLLYAAQVEVSPPRILLFLNYPKGMHFSYLRFLKNAIRDEFGFEGSDIKLVCRKRS